jgi:DNA-binding response OmpR family regulator
MPRILIVDDETFIRVLYKTEFESEGYQVDVAAGADEALDVIAAVRPDVVILDIELGENNGNGLELLNRLREDAHECAIILNSAYATYKSDFQTWLADAYLMKSSDLRPLKAKVQELLAKGMREEQTGL